MVAPPPRECARPAGEVQLRRSGTVGGVVTAVDAGSVSIRGFDLRYGDIRRQDLRLVSVGGRPPILCTRDEETRHRLTLTLPNGEVATFRRDDMPAVRFAASGGDPPSPAASYRPADVRVGDEVTLWLDRDAPDGFFRGVQIERRPGGRVPPAPGEDPDSGYPWHEYANAMQDWEERGVPLPDKYDPVKLRRMLAANREVVRRYQAKQAALERLAPPPREVPPKPPAP
ncbi:MAG: hypothetical protein K2X87_07380 [Gemmataceae bacterium]|nr:hypothetical protein [Gemmataceae bacterium]